MWIKILIAVVVIVVGILIYAASKPDTFSVVRTVHIDAVPEQVFDEINDFKRWQQWSPWEKMDPNMQRTLSGSAKGVGAKYAWSGNDKVGQGSMEITESNVPQKIMIKLDFLKPFECHNIAQFDLTPDAAGTNVRWEMRGPNLFVGKLMSVFMDMDQMVGKDFETGLANLKQLVESSSRVSPAPAGEGQPNGEPQSSSESQSSSGASVQ